MLKVQLLENIAQDLQPHGTRQESKSEMCQTDPAGHSVIT